MFLNKPLIIYLFILKMYLADQVLVLSMKVIFGKLYGTSQFTKSIIQNAYES